jgi:hypothetical protein
VPVASVVYGGDGATVLAVVEDRVQARRVQPGLSAGGFVQVIEGLAAGERVVARAGSFSADGDVVRPVLLPGRGGKRPRTGAADAPQHLRLGDPEADSLDCPVHRADGARGVQLPGLPITRFPNIDVPIVNIVVTQAGAAPSELLNQVTKRVEDAVAGVNGVKHIVSGISEGLSNTTIQFQLEVDTDRAVNDVKDAIAKIRADLPRTIDEPIVQRIDIEGLPILTYAAASPAMTPEELSWFVDDVAARALQSVRGVGGVERIGGVDREIRVTLNPDRLLALGVTAAEVNKQLRLTSVDLAGGRGEVGGQEQSIRTLSAAQSVETLAETSIVLPGGRKVRLDELATITDGSAEPRTFARFNGEPVVAFAVTRAKGASDAWCRQRSQEDRRSAPGPPGHAARADRFVGHLHGRQLRSGDEDPDRGCDSRRHRGVHLPARLARHLDLGAGAAALGDPDLLGDEHAGLLAQPRQPARVDARHRHPGRRRHRRDREHRAPPAHGQIALPGALEAADEIGLAVIAIT